VPSEKLLRRLQDILDNIARIERFTAGMDFTAFGANEQALYASLHAPLIVSEAARKLGDQADILVPGQPWSNLRSIGNVLPRIRWRRSRDRLAGRSQRRFGLIEEGCCPGSVAVATNAGTVLSR
jgi:uncharacterized protein with HEPN domain